jgi:hypothetical protein
VELLRVVLALRYLILPVAIIVIAWLVRRHRLKRKAAQDIIEVEPIEVSDSNEQECRMGRQM